MRRAPKRNPDESSQDAARLRNLDRVLRILLEEKATLHQMSGSPLDSGDKPVMIAVSLLEREPGIALRKTLGLCIGERNEPATEAAQVSSPVTRRAQVPSE